MNSQFAARSAPACKAFRTAPTLYRRGAKPGEKSLARLTVALALAPVMLVAVLAGAIDPSYVPWLMSDISSTANVNPWTGAMSSSGALLWLAAATTSLFASQLLKGETDPAPASFLRWAGIISAYMCIDDLFLLHEAVEYLFGISDKVIFIPLGAAILYFLISFRGIIANLGVYPLRIRS